MKTRVFVVSCLLGSLCAISAQAVEPTVPIVTPADARTHGLEDLRKAKNDIAGPDLDEFLKPGPAARKALLQLGKIAFWDQQVGSGGRAGIPGQACASCHFHAGADPRNRNQLNPNLTRLKDVSEGEIIGFHDAPPDPDTTFQTRRPNQALRFRDFPFVRVINEVNDPGNSNDVASSQGVLRTTFQRVIPAEPDDLCRDFDDPIFKTHGRKVRRVEPRHTPTVINAFLTSFFAFWDGRANPFYNGQNPFGVQDPSARILVFRNDTIEQKRIDIPFSALASQASGPPLSDFEMSCGVPEIMNARSWPEIGKKLFRTRNGASLVPLGQQLVASDDSVLGEISNFPNPGVSKSYGQLIRLAFKGKYWRARGFRVEFKGADLVVVPPAHPMVQLDGEGVAAEGVEITNDERVIEPTLDVLSEAPLVENPAGQRFTLMEANAALFLPLAIQAYEQTLISDDTWFDRWMRTGSFNEGFGARERAGLNVFVDKGRCINCHGGPELTNASVRNMQANPNNGRPDNLIEPMIMGDNNNAIYDNGFYNISVTPTFEDIGRGGKGPTGAPLSSSRQRLFEENKISEVPFRILGGERVPAVSEEGEKVCIDVDNNGFCDLNEPLLDPFQRVAVDGAFKTPGLRLVDLTGPYWHNGAAATLKQVVEFYDNGGNFCRPNIDDLDPDIQSLELTSAEKRNLVQFMISLNDRRVIHEQAPFDHPSLTVADSGQRNGTVIRIPAVGAGGREPLGLPPLRPFLGVNQQRVGNAPVDVVCSPNVLP